MTEFARQAKVQLLFPYDLAANIKVHPVIGQYSVTEALNIMLSDTGLSGHLTERGFVTVSRIQVESKPVPESQKMNVNKKRTLFSAVLAMLSATSTGNAQEAVGDYGSDLLMEEIVVTAQKREERLQDVPISVSALSGTQLDRLGASDFKDVLRYIPGVSYSGEEHGQSKYNIRGVSTTSTSPTVGVYLDDISLVTVATNFSGAADPIFFDTERLEVLKGPQGTLYGGNAMGGAIKFVSRKPVLNETGVEAEAGLATTDGGAPSYEGEVIANFGVIEDTLAIRTGFLFREIGGYIDQVPNGLLQDWRYSATMPPDPFVPSSRTSLATHSAQDINDVTITVGRLSALWTPTDTLTIVPSAFIQSYEYGGANLFRVTLPEFQISNRLEESGKDELDVFSLTITQEFAKAEFTSLTGYVDRAVNFDRDYTFFIGSLVPDLFEYDSPNISDSYSTNFSQEFRLASDLGDSPWQWLFGLFYTHQKDHLFQQVTTHGASDFFGTDTDVVYVGDTYTATDEYAAFGEVTYSVTDKFDAVLGLRYFSIEQKIDAEYDGVFNGGATFVSGAKQKEDGVNPKLSLVYQLAENNMLFLSGSKGFRQGGPNRFNPDPDLCREDLDRLGLDAAPDAFDSDNIWSYELGSKNQFVNGTVTVNGSLFYTDWTDIQQSVEMSCGFNFTGNVGAAEIKGSELEAQLRLSENLTLFGGLTYMDATITESAPGLSAQKGQNVLDVPEWMYSFSAIYNAPLSAEWAMTLQGDYQYHGSNYRAFDPLFTTNLPDGSSLRLPNPAQIQESYDIVNAYFLVSNDVWEYRLYVKNAFNASPYLYYGLFDPAGANTLRPRTIGISVRTRF
ncbi:MAG: TonB-dependent receptor [Xanthomonadales bacterium]|nr:TonB-dependent receptor [Xanthomonadales bacterium]